MATIAAMTRTTRCVAFLLMLALSAQAIAQFGGSRRGGQDGGDRRSRGPAGGEPSESARLGANDQVRMNLATTRLTLKLTPEQDALWQAYAAKVVDLLSDLGRGVTVPAGEDAVRQIDRRVDVVRNRLAAMEDIAEAARSFYAALSAEQKQVADQMMPGTLPALYGAPAAPMRGPRRE
jgi:hypothetical protein